MRNSSFVTSETCSALAVCQSRREESSAISFYIQQIDPLTSNSIPRLGMIRKCARFFVHWLANRSEITDCGRDKGHVKNTHLLSISHAAQPKVRESIVKWDICAQFIGYSYPSLCTSLFEQLHRIAGAGIERTCFRLCANIVCLYC